MHTSLARFTSTMAKLVACAFTPSGHLFHSPGGRRCRGGLVVRARASSFPGKLSTFSSSIYTNLPLLESPGASFAEYICDRPRVFQAMFPDVRRSQRLNDDEWRIQMLPLEFLFLSVKPVVDMRLLCLTQAKDYPRGIPDTVPTVLHLQATRWQLRELEDIFQPTSFSLSIEGTLFSDKNGPQSRLKGQMTLSISCILPPAMSIVPEEIVKGVTESILTRLVENMKQKVNQSLISDFGKFRREKLQKVTSRPEPPSNQPKFANRMKKA